MLRTRIFIATALDRLALRMYEAGHSISGQRGGWLADRLVDASTGSFRNMLKVPCTCGRPHD